MATAIKKPAIPGPGLKKQGVVLLQSLFLFILVGLEPCDFGCCKAGPDQVKEPVPFQGKLQPSLIPDGLFQCSTS